LTEERLSNGKATVLGRRIEKHENIASLAAIVIFVVILVVYWLVSGRILWPIIVGMLGPLLALLLAKWMKGQYQDGKLRYQDERFTQLYNLASRNALVFLIFILPILCAILFIQSIGLEVVASLILVWALSIVVFYASLLYYYRR